LGPEGHLSEEAFASIATMDSSKEIGHKEPYYNTKILIFSFSWAGLAAFHKPSTI
jgi:hypothetical protein